MKEYNKQYTKEHKDKLNEYRKQYNNDNRDKIRERQKQIVVCECGCEIQKWSLYHHKKTKNHQIRLASIQTNDIY